MTVYGSISLLWLGSSGLKGTSIFIFLNAIQVTYSLCRTIPALFLIIPEKCMFCTATVYISGKNQVKKNSVVFYHPLCVYTCAQFGIIPRYTIQYFYEGSRHFSLIPSGVSVEVFKELDPRL